MSNVSFKLDRRRVLATAAVTLATTQFSMLGYAKAQTGATKPADQPTMKPGTNTPFGPLKQIDAGLLNSGYAQAGKSDDRGLCSYTAGPTISIAMLMLHLCWYRLATG